MSKLYKLDLPMYWAEEDEKARILIPKLKELLHEILGYSDEEIRIMEEKHFSNDIARNLTGEQARKIAQPFHDWNISAYLGDNATNELLAYNTEQLYLQPITVWRSVRNMQNRIRESASFKKKTVVSAVREIVESKRQEESTYSLLIPMIPLTKK